MVVQLISKLTREDSKWNPQRWDGSGIMVASSTKRKLTGKGPETVPSEECRCPVHRAGMQMPQVNLAAMLKTNQARHGTSRSRDLKYKTLCPCLSSTVRTRDV